MKTSQAVEPLALSVAEAAEQLGVSTRTLASMVAAGEIPYAKIRRRTVFPRAALERWLAQRTERSS